MTRREATLQVRSIQTLNTPKFLPSRRETHSHVLGVVLVRKCYSALRKTGDLAQAPCVTLRSAVQNLRQHLGEPRRIATDGAEAGGGQCPNLCRVEGPSMEVRHDNPLHALSTIRQIVYDGDFTIQVHIEVPFTSYSDALHGNPLVLTCSRFSHAELPHFLIVSYLSVLLGERCQNVNSFKTGAVG